MRILYLLYYFKELDWRLLRKFMEFTKERTGRTSLSLWFSMIYASIKYNISLLEYFQFRFYEIPESARAEFAGTGYMYEYQLKMNPPSSRDVLADKIKFLKQYSPFVHHAYCTIPQLLRDSTSANSLLANSSGKVVLKSSTGQCGRGIQVEYVSNLPAGKLIERLRASDNDLAEEFVVQHPDLMRLSSTGLNTVRIITQVDQKGAIQILAARLRISLDSIVDNLAAGNLAASIDLETGKVNGPGVFSDITRSEQYAHPLSGVSIEGFQVPYWPETLTMVREAAALDKRNRSIGWDVGITVKGPELIEANHDWCKLLWQLPARKGLKPVLEKYLE